jgi:hypothetical protein
METLREERWNPKMKILICTSPGQLTYSGQLSPKIISHVGSAPATNRDTFHQLNLILPDPRAAYL